MHSYVAHTSFSERHNRAQPLIPGDGPLVYRQSDFLFSDHIFNHLPIIVFAFVLERPADLPMRSSARAIHLFDSVGDDLPSDASLGPGFFITQR
jgi:hypothetical protein